MKTSIVAYVALTTCTTFATAQDLEGPHKIAVFTGQSVLSPRSGQPSATGAPAFTLGRQFDFDRLAQPDLAAYPARVGIDGPVQYYGDRDRGIPGGGSWSAESSRGDRSNRAWGMSIGVDFGAFSLRAAHQNLNAGQFRVYDLSGRATEAKNSIVAANYRMGWGTAYAAYSINRGWGSSPLYNPDNPYGAGMAGTASTDSRDALVGVAVPVTGSITLLASYIRKNDRDPANRDANQFAFGASYVVSRKTDFYAALSHTVNTNGAGILIDGAARPSGSNAINIGMRHAF